MDRVGMLGNECVSAGLNIHANRDFAFSATETEATTEAIV